MRSVTADGAASVYRNVPDPRSGFVPTSASDVRAAAISSLGGRLLLPRIGAAPGVNLIARPFVGDDVHGVPDDPVGLSTPIVVVTSFVTVWYWYVIVPSG